MSERTASPAGPLTDAAIVIVSYNTVDLLRACLGSIPEAVAPYSSEIYVVDNASTDGSAEMVAAEFPDVRLTASKTNLGFSGGNNLILETVEARHALLLNPDTEAHRGSLATLVRFLDEHPDAGAVGPKLLNSDGTLQRNGAKFPTVLRELLGVTGLRRLAMRRYELSLGYGREDFDALAEVDQVSGACLMVRREALQKVGPLDARFFMFYEEIEWCHRIKAAGWKVYYVPEAVVTHHWMGSVKQESRRMTAELFRSQLLYYQKTSGPLSVLAIRLIMGAGLAKNALIHAGVGVKRRLRQMGLIGAKP
jgi:N-acetylglucosaminyl-diphospho-decaprenol L-rhamnosyltransferase